MNSPLSPDAPGALLPTIPEYITVHLGSPQSNARNVTVPFREYIANVASSEIFPTWPEAALRANILAQISFALNRIYTEFYPSRGYDFDITNSIANDQSFVDGREIFDNINEITGDIFDNYLVRQGFVEPLFATYCDGIEVTCPGLSQWGSVTLAERGLTPYAILQNYYGNDIDIVTDAPIENATQSAPSVPLRLGARNNDVRTVQVRLNRISENYPSIPKISTVDGIFSYDTEESVRQFQRVAGITEDGIVGKATWYAILFYYNAVKRLNELDSEGLTLFDVTQELPEVLRRGSRGNPVENLQYYINYLSDFYSSIPPVERDGIFGPSTEAAVIDMQNTFGLTPDGVVGEDTWNRMYNAYLGIVSTIPPEYSESAAIPFPGVILRTGAEGEEVSVLQRYLNRIGEVYGEIPSVNVTGYFGNQTASAVSAFQELFGLTLTNGVVDAVTWNEIGRVFDDVTSSDRLAEGQYPGFPVE